MKESVFILFEADHQEGGRKIIGVYKKSNNAVIELQKIMKKELQKREEIVTHVWSKNDAPKRLDDLSKLRFEEGYVSVTIRSMGSVTYNIEEVGIVDAAD